MALAASTARLAQAMLAAPMTALLGRQNECDALDRLITGVRAGDGRALVVRGKPGIGKSALLDYIADHARGCDVLRTAGAEAETGLEFAGLQRLCAPLLPRLATLPEPQHNALAGAFGLQACGSPDRYLLGLAVHGMLAAAGATRPVVCIVDDAQWLDAASTQILAFVARRLRAQSVGLVIALRLPDDARCTDGLPTLDLLGLADDDAKALLDSALLAPLDIQIRDRFVAETDGNPAALLALPGDHSPEELAGGFGPARIRSRPIEDRLQQRLLPLPPSTRRLLLLAAAEPLGDPALVWRAATELEIDASSAGPAAAAGLIDLGAPVRFVHPTLRSAVYEAASLEDRQAVHRALATATDSTTDPDRRAWHLAQATAGVDEDVAAQLEQSADRARNRGGLAAAAAFLERAAELTPEPSTRARRALAAATSKHISGARDTALRQLAIAEAGQLSGLERAQALLLRAQIMFAARSNREAAEMLLDATTILRSLDATRAREAYLDAFRAALLVGGPSDAIDIRKIAEAVLEGDRGDALPDSLRHQDNLLVGLALLLTRGYGEATPLLRDALRGLRGVAFCDDASLRWLPLACWVARALGDDEAWDELTDRWVRVARGCGALSVLPLALAERSTMKLAAGDRIAGQALATEARAALEANRRTFRLRSPVALAARDDAPERGEALWLDGADWRRAQLLNGAGRWNEALEAARAATGQPHELGCSLLLCAELVEAATRSGAPHLTDEPLKRLAEIALATGTDWAFGIEARSRALVNRGPEAERLYRRAIDRLGRTRLRVDLARAHLLYGEWLRREGRRVDARGHLRTAHELFSAMGVESFAARAQRELLATGETARRRIESTRGDLTAQEAEIARLAAQGHTNPQIGARLFISPRTVQYHLRKVFQKLGVRSRTELRNALPAELGVAQAAAA